VLDNTVLCTVLYGIGWQSIDITLVGDQDPDPQDPHVLGLPDPDPLIRGMDPAPAPATSLFP
jgi:hypothetical protein